MLLEVKKNPVNYEESYNLVLHLNHVNLINPLFNFVPKRLFAKSLILIL